jgi:2-dehydropantoate 2-reductase
LVASTLSGAGLSVRVSPNALEVIWAKVAFNCVMNTLCSIASIPVSALARYDGFDALASSVLDEIAAVARAEGVIVDTAATLRLMRAQFDPSASGDHLASMLQDLMNGRPTEIAQLNGAIAARAASHGIDAPVNAAITGLVGLLEATWTGRVNRLHPELP